MTQNKNDFHPKPWRVAYWRRCHEWHVNASPYIVDGNGNVVVYMPQHGGHPGAYDEQADKTAHQIVNAVNNA